MPVLLATLSVLLLSLLLVVVVALALALALLLMLSVPVPLEVWAGELEPHPLIGATTAIRARAACGSRFVLMCSPAGSDFH
ncbi:MAG: hypothetical protein JOY78_20540 [Pseudonocardia sp.]|nr:hypothetical protein [Pseudonocardia sp.]